MVVELRWILAAFSVLLLAGIWWWGARRSSQAPGRADLREAAPAPVEASPDQEPTDVIIDSGRGEWGVSPFEPLSIRTAHFEAADLDDLPMTAHAEPVGADDLDETDDFGSPAAPAAVRVPTLRSSDVVKSASVTTEPVPVVERRAAAAPWGTEARDDADDAEQATAHDGGFAHDESAAPESALPPPATPARTAANAAETQRIVSIRVAAAGDTRWPGPLLLAALEDHGLAYGRYQVFHRKHSDGRTLFCAANLKEPGTFNLEDMPADEFRGLTLFAVLPGPLEPLSTLDALLDTAGQLAATLRGVVQDSKGVPLTLERASYLREEVARFQASLSMH